jgi:Flp pilus assembly protein TadG
MNLDGLCQACAAYWLGLHYGFSNIPNGKEKEILGHMAMNKAVRLNVAAGRRRRRGAVIVELSFTLVPLLAMMFAIADFAMPIFLHSTFTAAVREGVRFGVTYNTAYNGTTYSSQTDAIKAVVQANTLGFLTGSTGLSKISVKYYLPVSPFGQVTGTGANANGNILEVSVAAFNWLPMAPVGRLASALSVGAISSDRLESLGVGATRPTP